MTSTSPKRILVVDDDEAIQETVSIFLESEGFEVVTAGNGQIALDVLKSENGKFGLILLDLYMPKMTGWQFAKLLRENGTEDQKKIPIVITSAVESDAGEAAASQFEGFLQKPFNLEKMVETCLKFCH